MTTRERASLGLLLLGAVALIIAAASLGWAPAVATAGGLMVAGGVLLGLGDDEAAPAGPYVEPHDDTNAAGLPS